MQEGFIVTFNPIFRVLKRITHKDQGYKGMTKINLQVYGLAVSILP